MVSSDRIVSVNAPRFPRSPSREFMGFRCEDASQPGVLRFHRPRSVGPEHARLVTWSRRTRGLIPATTQPLTCGASEDRCDCVLHLRDRAYVVHNPDVFSAVFPLEGPGKGRLGVRRNVEPERIMDL